jgi:hypothetical protein
VVRFRIRARFDPADWQIAEVENEKSKEVPMTEVYEELREKGFNFAEMAEGNWKKNLAGTAACENSIAGNADGLVVPRNVPSVPASQPAPPNAIAKPTAQYLSEMIRWTLGPLVDPAAFRTRPCSPDGGVGGDGGHRASRRHRRVAVEQDARLRPPPHSDQAPSGALSRAGRTRRRVRRV